MDWLSENTLGPNMEVKKKKTKGMEKTRLTKRTMKQRRMMVKGLMKVKRKAKYGDADDFLVLIM